MGVAKQSELELMYGGGELDTMFAIKRVLDPQDLLNPRKVFPVHLFDESPAAPGGPERR